eukprot:jgi/Orpsp1_1/1174609/evm.model.c7180000050748.1
MKKYILLLLIIVLFNYCIINASASVIKKKCIVSKSSKVQDLVVEEKNFNKYYDKQNILDETQWKDIEVQEHENNSEVIKNFHLSLISQGVFNPDSGLVYDDNYYYPASAGKGIDIYVIDTGLDVSLNEEDFDTYEGTPDERIIRCEGIFTNGVYEPALDEKNCHSELQDDFIEHGTLVSIAAVGKINGVAKKANLHVLAIYDRTYNVLAALDYVKEHAKPHKTVVNISTGCVEEIENCSKYEEEVQKKLKELVDLGIIIVVASGNESHDACKGEIYASYHGVIPVGSFKNIYHDLDNIYEIASYSNYGQCIDVFAPGYIYVKDSSGEVKDDFRGTSFSSPFTAGVAALIMSEHPEINYTYESMRQALIDLSIKDAIKGLNENTPNRLLNNGKVSIYGKPRCDDPSGQYQCHDQCCSKNGICIDPKDPSNEESCLIENECHSEFGYCSTRQCGIIKGKEYKCKEGECCSKYGECENIMENDYGSCFLESGCQSEFSDLCLSSDPSKFNDYDEKYHQEIYKYQCKEGLRKYNDNCNLYYGINLDDSYDKNEHTRLCDQYQHNSECIEFLNDPIKFVPICEKVDDFEYMKEELMNKNPLILARNEYICTKKDSQLSDEFCIDNIDKINIKNIYGNEIYKTFCGVKECSQSLIEYAKKIKQYNDYTTKICDEIINYLSSEECNSSIKN